MDLRILFQSSLLLGQDISIEIQPAIADVFFYRANQLHSILRVFFFFFFLVARCCASADWSLDGESVRPTAASSVSSSSSSAAEARTLYAQSFPCMPHCDLSFFLYYELHGLDGMSHSGKAGKQAGLQAGMGPQMSDTRPGFTCFLVFLASVFPLLSRRRLRPRCSGPPPQQPQSHVRENLCRERS